ncbi:hypothetical protein [Rhodococcus qingshengii]|uniref:hypothetical protein n=1 Tax=Rhodococcus qingshengii TaxID=334542 RepID=UPI00237C7871|nr:hypothetical protein [Rhodococcus qingshengii]WCT06162.1 hypothetical protein PI247_31075 [Rhodococcus qingshengii]
MGQELIIAADTSNKPAVWLTNKNAAEWHGISERSIQAGIDDLRGKGLLDIDETWVKAPQSGIGATCHHHYSLTGAFSSEERTKIRRRAQADLKKRTLAVTTPTPKKGKRGKKGTKKRSTTIDSVPQPMPPPPGFALPPHPTSPQEKP